MRDLKSNFTTVRKAFKYHFFAQNVVTSSALQKHYLAAYAAETDAEFLVLKDIIADGLNLFQSFFGFRSESFIAANYVWPQELESFLANKKIRFIQSQRGQIAPVLNLNKRKNLYHYFGQKNKYNQRFFLRNVLFEPYINQDYDWVDAALKEIGNAFLFNQPAIICSHRINYVSGMSVENRDKSLFKLRSLLKAALKKWPDVRFMSSDQLGRHCFPSSTV
ncbi:hypothetical protein A3SI_06799 [Nitritalea halalkaliphila LW7]|uniref:Uncharacterized protein n=2 Tax=Nitritalea TaxID=1187887 RepID=I5C623_9BACT|nr:hypothetical protein A3SI_06799 [Nitritalea halalkaliphila LW7]